MCTETVQNEQTCLNSIQTLPIRELDVAAPRDDVARFIIKMLYEAEEEGFTYTLDEFVKHFLLFGPESKRSHLASVRELKRAIVWLSNQKILYVTKDLHVQTEVEKPLHTSTWLQRVTGQSVAHFRKSFGQKANHWFYGNA